MKLFKKKIELKLTEELVIELMKKAALNPNTAVELVLKDGTILRMNCRTKSAQDIYL